MDTVRNSTRRRIAFRWHGFRLLPRHKVLKSTECVCVLHERVCTSMSHSAPCGCMWRLNHFDSIGIILPQKWIGEWSVQATSAVKNHQMVSGWEQIPCTGMSVFREAHSSCRATVQTHTLHSLYNWIHNPYRYSAFCDATWIQIGFQAIQYCICYTDCVISKKLTC